MDVTEIIQELLTIAPQKQFTIIVVGGEAFSPNEDEEEKLEGDVDVESDMDYFSKAFEAAIFGPATAVGGGGGGGGDSTVYS